MRHDYVDNKKLHQVYSEFIYAVREVKEAGGTRDDWPKIPDYLATAIINMSRKLGTRYNFAGYSFIEEMIDDAIENCILYIDKYNPDKYSNAFAYLTQIMINAFVRRIHREKKEMYIKYKNVSNISLAESLESNFGSTFERSVDFNAEKYDSFIETYEQKQLKKKVKKKGLEVFFNE